MCNVALVSDSATTTDPEAPEMILPTPGAFFGIVGEPGQVPRLIFCCSRQCVIRLLREDE